MSSYMISYMDDWPRIWAYMSPVDHACGACAGVPDHKLYHMNMKQCAGHLEFLCRRRNGETAHLDAPAISRGGPNALALANPSLGSLTFD
jgi:hypothetical protein